MRVRLSLLIVSAITIALSACSGTGPAGRDLVSAGQGLESNFVLVPVDENTIGIVSAWHHPSLSAVFGDYRKAATNHIGVGDTVQINIWEAGAGGIFSNPAADHMSSASRATLIPEQVVSRDGMINVPYAGRIKVVGKAPSEVEDLIIQQLKGRSAQPQVMVTVTRNLSNSVTVTGDITNGARIPLSAVGDRVLDVITQAGGLRAPVHETYITLCRDGRTLNVPMQVLLSNSKENIYVRAGDVITVVRATQSFTAVGATGRQAHVPFDAAGLTLEEALGKAGGLLDEKADPEGVFVLRYESAELVKNYPGVQPHLLAFPVVAVAYQLNMKDPASLFYARRFAIRNKDILYVSSAPLNEFEKLTRAVSSLTSPAITAYQAYSITP
jgi:polysaccharide biosynthesis/export protein